MKPAKYELLQKLDHIVSSSGVPTDPGNIVAIKNWPAPKCLKELQAFLGPVEYYRQYLRDFATNAEPLNRLMAKDTEWNWSEEAQKTFQKKKGD